MATGPVISLSRARGGRSRRLVAEINVTPLVDVMLVLLVIFMVTAPLLTASVEVDLPKTEAATSRGQDEPLIISINGEGKIYLADTEMDVETLVARLKAVTENKPDQRIFVRGDKSLQYGRIMEVMGNISAAGFTKVALVAEIPAGPAGGRAQPARPQAARPAR
jgi:biopolymer transport protein TolR